MGQANQLGIGLQPLSGGVPQQKTAASAAAAFLPLTDGSIGPEFDTLEHRAMEGDRFPLRQKRGGRQYSGPLNGGFRPMSTGILLSMLLGTPTTTSLQTGVYQHVWNPKAAGKVPMPGTVWTIQNDIYQQTGQSADKVVDQFIGTFLNEFSFNVEGNEYLLFEGEAVALRQVEDVAAPVATLDQTALWSFDEVSAELSVPSISSGTYQPFLVYDWGMSYNNDMQGLDRFPVGSKEAVKGTPGNVESEMEFTAAENLEAHYRRAIADFPELCKLKLTATGKQIYEGATDLFESISAEFMGVEYRSGDRPLTAEDIWEDVEITAGVVKDASGNYMTITMVNEHDGSAYAPA